jgi:phospholipid/cholesterol/gamma-HCH transport system ATP-binding protein
MLEYIAVYKAFDAPVLAGVNLRVAQGETMAIVGHSGTGKSVLLKTTIGLIVPDRGDVRIDGLSVFHSDRRTVERLRRKSGYVFQNAALFDSMTVFENVSQGIPEEQLRDMRTGEAVRRVAEALELVNLSPRAVLAKLPAELSGGMRKRVGLARAIVGKPEILLYDEPVTGLDPVNATIVHELIERLGRELGVTSILVTHDIEGALPISDHVAMLDSGRIRFVGTPDEFRTSKDPLVRAFLERTALIERDRVLEAV